MGYLEESKQRDIFAKNLNKVLDDRGLRQRDVAIALDIAPTTFNTWTRGKAMPSVAVIRKIADYLGIGMTKLIDDQSDKESPLDFSYREVLLIEKYRKLGSEEKEAVDTMLDRISKYASLLSEGKK